MKKTFKNFEEGTITEGRVVVIQKDRVIVDIGYKSEGIISANPVYAGRTDRVGGR